MEISQDQAERYENTKRWEWVKQPKLELEIWKI